MSDLINRKAAIDAVRKLYIKEPKINNDYAYNMAIDKADDAIRGIPSAERRGRWTIDAVHQYELAYGATAYEPVYKCSCCGCLTESYLRLDEPIMPDDADFPKWCGNCGARMEAGE